ncbi:methyltransferase [Kocuria coralli]|uniref:Methyltransferase n=1 Tax=Kocuria coralli TaxID=1461025 RepID=A0A5J5KWG8_9MICC|nr:methyltransferase [Kocuria coralli]KAA9393610.1 methyltransferase [Kocuria coralli]
MTAHYFTTPEGPETRSELEIELRGRSVRVATSAGVFSPRALDKGTAVLLDAVPAPEGHEFLDLGCGWGPLTLAMGLAARDRLASGSGSASADDDGADVPLGIPGGEESGPRITAVDVNERSLALTRDNAVAVGLAVEALLPGEVPADRLFDTMWSNPPIRIGKEALHELLLHWLPRLSPAGAAWMVVQKNLGADSLQKWLLQALPERTGQEWTVERISSSRGFRVLKVSRRSP